MRRPFVREWFTAWTRSSLWDRRVLRVPALALIVVGGAVLAGAQWKLRSLLAYAPAEWCAVVVSDYSSCEPTARAITSRAVLDLCTASNQGPSAKGPAEFCSLEFWFFPVRLGDGFGGLVWSEGREDFRLSSSAFGSLYAYRLAESEGRVVSDASAKFVKAASCEGPIKGALSDWLNRAAPQLGAVERATLLEKVLFRTGYGTHMTRIDCVGLGLDALTAVGLLFVLAGLKGGFTPTQAELIAARFRLSRDLCTECGYDLAGLRASGPSKGPAKCPECGTTFDP